MKFYLSSDKIGNKADELKVMIPKNGKIGVVPNALDYVAPKSRKESNEKIMKDLTDLGIKVDLLDLQKYFDKKKQLRNKIDSLAGIWVRGGNTFVLRQAMRLSGLDEILKNMNRSDFVYGGYSAGGCVL